MKYYYCLRCKSFAVTDPAEAHCDKCKRELADEITRRGWNAP